MVAVQLYYDFDGIAVAPEDVQFGEVDSQEVSLARLGVVTKTALVRKSVTLTLRGLNTDQSQPYVNQAQRTSLNLIRGRADVRTLTFGLETIEDAVLVKAIPSVPILVDGQALYDSLQLEFHSQKYV